ncbi:hypothetical protein G6F68_016796 [Rhizopus microsporus]|nr:hypothetical protein G6F68_016796 [Rhizopus microsporus]
MREQKELLKERKEMITEFYNDDASQQDDTGTDRVQQTEYETFAGRPDSASERKRAEIGALLGDPAGCDQGCGEVKHVSLGRRDLVQISAGPCPATKAE